jgi:L-lactate dehydrogenase
MTHEIHHPVRVAIVGVGNVGATFAFSLLNSGLATEIVLIDANTARAEGEAMDLNHAVPLSQSTRIWAGSMADTAGALLTVITAGSAQKPGETRLDLAGRNVNILRTLIHDVAKNPVDILTYAAIKISGFPPNQVFGSGTILDTARFRYLLSQHFGVDPRSVHGYIIGEHGDSEVPVWSLANIAGMRLPVFCQQNNFTCQDQVLDDIFQQTRDAAYQIIQRKGATYYAIAVGLTKIAEAIIRDQNTVLSVSSLINDYYGIQDVCFSLPSVVDRGGVERILRLELSDRELEGLQKSAVVLKEMHHSLGL